MTTKLRKQCSKQRTNGSRNQVHQKHMTSHQISNSLCSQPTDKNVNRLSNQPTDYSD